MGNEHEYVVGQLVAIPRSEWTQLALDSGVPRSTIEKIAYRVTKRPSFTTISNLFTTLRKRMDAGAAHG